MAPTSPETPKKVVIVSGPPGSGKSVIAARLWASLVTDPNLPDGDVVFTTTSMSQNSNWSHLFDQASPGPGASGIVRKASGYSPHRSRMDVRVFDNPVHLEAALRQRHAERNSVRLLASFSRAWKTVAAADPHALPPSSMDFHEPCTVDGQTRVLTRVWNVLGPGNDYTWFVSGHQAGRIAHDPLCEVGCPYVVRGFDYDYVGILWLNDLIWRASRWRVDPNAVEETGFMNMVLRARRELDPEGPATSQLLRRVAQTYRILFTRALKGVYVWVPDPETRAHFASSLE